MMSEQPVEEVKEDPKPGNDEKPENPAVEPASKPALKSKGVWGSLVAAIAGAVLTWAGQEGVELPPLVNSLLELATVVGGSLALWGRADAKGPVHFKKQG